MTDHLDLDALQALHDDVQRLPAIRWQIADRHQEAALVVTTTADAKYSADLVERALAALGPLLEYVRELEAASNARRLFLVLLSDDAGPRQVVGCYRSFVAAKRAVTEYCRADGSQWAPLRVTKHGPGVLSAQTELRTDDDQDDATITIEPWTAMVNGPLMC